MIHKISFSNVYNFKDTVEINFDSKTDLYVIYGDSCSGKTNLLSVIEIILHVFWDRPNYENLHKIVNRNSNSSIINMYIEFTFRQHRYSYYGEIDLDQNCFTKQSFKYTSSNKHLYYWDSNELHSDYFSPQQISLLNTFKYSKHGIFPYINALEDGNKIEELKAIRSLAKTQDYIDLNIIFSNQTNIDNIISLLHTIEPNLQSIEVFASDLTKQKVQGTPTELSNPRLKHSLDVTVVFKYPGYEMTLKQHSTGFINLFKLCIEFFAAEQETFFQPRLIDNFTAYLNEDILEQLLLYFSQSYQRQLIFTSYNQLILEHKLLPKESIIIINKDQNNSVITKLSNFKNLRNDDRHNWRKMYRQGKFNIKKTT